MLTTEEKHEIEEAIRLVPVRKAAGLEALKIVQEHRRWISDESLHDVAECLIRKHHPPTECVAGLVPFEQVDLMFRVRELHRDCKI